MAKNRFAGLATSEQKQSEFVTFEDLKARSTPRLMKVADTEPIGDLQIRSEGIDPVTSTNKLWVEELVAKLQRNPELKAEGDIVIAGVTDIAGVVGRYVRLDGNHFITAALIVVGDKADDLELMVKYVECTEVELESASYGTNATHGLQLNNKEKVFLARKLLKKYPQLTDGAIEKLAPVLIAKTIGNQRRWLVENENVSFPSKRMTLDGKWIETASIGSVKPVETPKEAPKENLPETPEWALETAPVKPTGHETVTTEAVLSTEQQAAAKNGRFIPAQTNGALPEPKVTTTVSAQRKESAPVACAPMALDEIPGGGKYMEFDGVGFLIQDGLVTIESTFPNKAIPVTALNEFIRAWRRSEAEKGIVVGK